MRQVKNTMACIIIMKENRLWMQFDNILQPHGSDKQGILRNCTLLFRNRVSHSITFHKAVIKYMCNHLKCYQCFGVSYIYKLITILFLV